MRKRNVKITVRTTESEKRKIEALAKKTGMGIGETLRCAALGKIIYQIEDLKPLLHELKGIGRNLNQMTVLAHEGRVSFVDLRYATAMLGKIYERVNKIYGDMDAVIVGTKGA